MLLLAQHPAPTPTTLVCSIDPTRVISDGRSVDPNSLGPGTFTLELPANGTPPRIDPGSLIPPESAVVVHEDSPPPRLQGDQVIYSFSYWQLVARVIGQLQVSLSDRSFVLDQIIRVSMKQGDGQPAVQNDLTIRALGDCVTPAAQPSG